MRFHNVLQRVYGEPWQITPAGWYSIHQIVMAHYKAPALTPVPESKRPERGIFGEKLAQMEIANGVARIPIFGTILKGASLMEKSCGAVSHDDIHEDLDSAAAAGVKAIVLEFNSPGGTVMGTPEVAAKIGALKQNGVPVYVFTDQLLCSAAYFMAAGASQIFCAPSAIVGSIGTIWEFYNVARQLAAAGIEFDIFTSGKFKGMGHPARQLTEDQKALAQSHVDHTHAEFSGHVKKFRPQVGDKSMQGQIFTGRQALAAGLVDGFATSIREVLDRATKSTNVRASASGTERTRAAIRAEFETRKASRPDFSHLRGTEKLRAIFKHQMEQKNK